MGTISGRYLGLFTCWRGGALGKLGVSRVISFCPYHSCQTPFGVSSAQFKPHRGVRHDFIWRRERVAGGVWDVHSCLSTQGFSEDSWAVMLTQMQRCGSLVIVRAGSGMKCPWLHPGGTVPWLSKWGKWKWKSISHVWLFVTPMDYRVHGILQARIPESSQPRDWTQVSHIAGRFFTSWATRKAQEYWSG